MFTIKYNAATNHIDGVAVRTAGEGVEAGGTVSYYAQNACGSITRYRLAEGKAYESLADALDAAHKGGRKLCKTCEKAALAQLAAEAEEAAPTLDDAVNEETNEEAGNMTTGKLKLSEVRGDIMIGATGGYSGTPHALKLTGDKWAPYCPTKAKVPFKSWGQAHEQNGKLELCVKCSALVETGPVEMVVETVSIPGLDREIKVRRTLAVPTDRETPKTETEEKEVTMAVKTMDKAAQAKAEQEIRAGIERVVSLIAERKHDSAKELMEELNKDRAKITGTGAAGIKATLRADQEKAVETAAAALNAEVEVKATPEIETNADSPQVAAFVAKGVENVEKSVQLGKSVAELADDMMDVIWNIRVAMINPATGLPDLTSKGKKTKDKAGEGYKIVEAKLDADDATGKAAINSLKRGVQNRTAAKTATWLGHLNEQPEFARETFPQITEGEYAEMEPEAAVRALYAAQGIKLPEMSRAELQTAKKNAELTDGSEGGDGDGEENEEDGDDTTTPAAKRVDVYLDKAGEFFGKTEKKLSPANIKKLTDEEKKSIKAKIDSLVAEAAALGALLK
ncbi:hypothetical protein NJL88_08975 [Streptomyces sp. DK15]|uniref:hypothetical protein n=1 Tax=Streptomyces sp. DK15 TaxID=2957499 RepID=UPI0029A6CFCC|nr:hypothetical protein [Streptomyces sp. DK15]MDX2390196.1 hypothetical protein [Streptomyces sp. DK15]